jgi:adenylate cyclase
MARAGPPVRAAEPEPAHAAAVSGMAREILIVDDDEIVRSALGRALESDGYRVHEASSGEEALQLLEHTSVQMLISDYDMSGMNGIEPLKEVRRRHPKVCRIMLTGSTDRATAVRSINEGEVYRFIEKPWDNELLRITVQFAFEALGLQEALDAERERSEMLLLNVLPREIAVRLRSGEATIADEFAQATVLFSDLVGFTEISSRMRAPNLVKLLGEVFSEFDRLAEARGLEKIKTIGDGYMVAAGVPVPRADHADAIADMALAMIEALREFAARTGIALSMRIGINSGPVVAGVIGKRKFTYDLWGDTVNTASRMESHGLPWRVQMTAATKALLGNRFACEERGEIDVKGKGPMRTYWLVSAAPTR